MRFFIALEIPPESKKQLQSVQQNLKKIIPQARLTDNQKLHLTVAFVGERPANLKNQLTEVIKKAAFSIPPFKVTPAYIDGFPSLHHPHTFWVGVKGDIDKLFLIREKVKDGLFDLGLTTEERRYIPHLAVAKINNNFKLRHNQEARLEKIMAAQFSPMEISSIKLFESIPEHGFHQHNTLAEINLKI